LSPSARIPANSVRRVLARVAFRPDTAGEGSGGYLFGFSDEF